MIRHSIFGLSDENLFRVRMSIRVPTDGKTWLRTSLQRCGAFSTRPESSFVSAVTDLYW